MQVLHIFISMFGMQNKITHLDSYNLNKVPAKSFNALYFIYIM